MMHILPNNETDYDEAVLKSPIPAIDVVNLSKRVFDADGELTILRELNFTVPTSQTMAIVGASGSGKSTLLGLLAGLDVPSTGSVFIDGTDIFSLNEDQRAALRKEKLGFVFQSFQLLGHLTAIENVMLPLELRGNQFTTAEIREKAETMLAKVGLSKRFKHYPKHLSGGEQQRVALVRAFITEPPLLLADEPTGSLDAVTGAKEMELMFSLNREHGSTLILVTHDPKLAKQCERVLTISAGALV